VNVALDTTDQPDVGIGIHEHLHVTQISDPLVDEEKDPVDDNDVRRLDSCVLDPSQVGNEIVLRLLDRIPFAQRVEMLAQEVVVEGVRMIPVEFASLVERQGGEVLVVRVHVDERHRRSGEEVGDVPCDGGFARARPTGDSDYQRFKHPAPKLRCSRLERIMPPSVRLEPLHFSRP